VGLQPIESFPPVASFIEGVALAADELRERPSCVWMIVNHQYLAHG
jgi:hypothetical protein